MHQIKIFKGLETEIANIERDINTWIANSKAKVVNIFGNMSPQSRAGGAAGDRESLSHGAYAPSDVFLVVVYEKS